ncbi:MAG: hypothetical protein HC890_15980 [Chloroflexaceae bacterium]|nr:hypothetical protein [Chloroflexaceae bacterium]
MTPVQVQSVAQEAVLSPQPPSQETSSSSQTLLTERWTLGEYQFNVLYNFQGSAPQLSEIVLQPVGNTEGLLTELNRHFGPPAREVGELQANSRNRSFSLLERDNFARPQNSASGSATTNQELAALVEWKTPTNLIQMTRQSSAEVTIRVLPAN